VIIRVGFPDGPFVHIDDERQDRMTPEVAEDYIARAREQVLAAYKEQMAYDIAMSESLDAEPDD
jgi:hypothetical protein